MGRKRKNNKVPKVNKELEGLDLNINEFGELNFNMDIDKINEFLTKTVPDKKLINRYDDKYQQEFKEQGLGGEPDEEEEPFIEETPEEEEDELDVVLGSTEEADIPQVEDIEEPTAESEDEDNDVERSK